MRPARLDPMRFRRGKIELGRHGRHFLHVELGGATVSLDRDQAGRLLRAFRALDALMGADATPTAFALLAAFRPGLRVEDVPVLRDWLERFAEELAVEDRRDQPRTWPARPIVL